MSSSRASARWKKPIAMMAARRFAKSSSLTRLRSAALLAAISTVGGRTTQVRSFR